MVKKYLPVKTFKSYEELIDNRQIDAVLVCTPPDLHYPIIQKASQKNIHVFVEKPFTTKVWEASDLTHLYKSRNLINQVGYVNRFNDIFIRVQELLKNRVIGDIKRFKSEMFSCTITQSNDDPGWRGSRKSGGGAVYEMASHAIDLVNYLIGIPDKIMGSSLNYIYSKNVEDAVFSTFLYKNGISGTLNVNWSDKSYRKPTNKIEIFGNGGRITADQHTIKIYMNKSNKDLDLNKGWNTLYITDVFKSVPFYVRGNEFTRQIYHFVDCIQNQEKTNICSFADGLNTLEVIEKIFHDYEKNGRL